MRRALTLTLAATLIAPAAVAQTAPAGNVSLNLFAAPAYLGRATAVTAAAPNLNVQVRSARVRGSWDLCAGANYTDCQTVTANQPLTNLTVRSARPTPTDTAAVSTGTTTTTTGTATTAKLDLDALDAAGGASGQDVEFYATPALGTDQISAGTNDKTAGDAFCRRAGATSSVYASRGRVQASNLIDLNTATRVRAFPLRDVLCRR